MHLEGFVHYKPTILGIPHDELETPIYSLFPSHVCWHRREWKMMAFMGSQNRSKPGTRMLSHSWAQLFMDVHPPDFLENSVVLTQSHIQKYPLVL